MYHNKSILSTEEIMKTEKNILIAFILNLVFSIFEFVGGIFTGSVAIISDAIHDIGDAASIGASFFLEKKSKQQPDEKYTYGYTRYSILGSVITTLILLISSVAVIFNAIYRIFYPTEINYNGMILFAIMGVGVNFCAAVFTRDGNSLNQKAVNLHMIEDVLGWIVVLAGAVIMRFTDFAIVDPLMSILVATYILIHTLKNLKTAIDIFLEKTPHNISISEIKEHLCEIESIVDVHHVHIWSMDEKNNYATMHLVIAGDPYQAKQQVRQELAEHGIGHVTLEVETDGESYQNTLCKIEFDPTPEHHHHRH